MSLAYTRYAPKARNRPFGSGWWTQRRNETLLRIMRDYGDTAKASRVLGCPEAAVIRQIRFLEHVMKAVPRADNDAE